jgi:Holliday junction resolvasome RuvABC DNA-binding subunit
MKDETAKTARLMKVAEAAVEEFERQGVVEAMANLGFDPMALARAVIKAADGDVIEFGSRRDR